MYKAGAKWEIRPGEWTRPGPPRRARCSTKLPLPPYSTSCCADAGSSHQTPFGSCLPLLLAAVRPGVSSLGSDPAGRARAGHRSAAGCGRRRAADTVQDPCEGSVAQGRVLSGLPTDCDNGSGSIDAETTGWR